MDDPGFEKLIKKVDNLENRLSRLESKFETPICHCFLTTMHIYFYS